MKFLTVEMDNFIKERVLYEVKVNKLSPADAHDKAKQALKDLILRVYGAETKAIYIKDYGLKPDVALQVAVSDCKIKIETYFDTKAPKDCNHLSGRLNQLNRCHGFPPSTGKKKHVNVYNRAQVYAWLDSHKALIQIVNDKPTKE